MKAFDFYAKTLLEGEYHRVAIQSGSTVRDALRCVVVMCTVMYVQYVDTHY